MGESLYALLCYVLLFWEVGEKENLYFMALVLVLASCSVHRFMYLFIFLIQKLFSGVFPLFFSSVYA